MDPPKKTRGRFDFRGRTKKLSEKKSGQMSEIKKRGGNALNRDILFLAPLIFLAYCSHLIVFLIGFFVKITVGFLYVVFRTK